MWVDKGHEFYNKDVQKLVELYSTESEEISFVIERFNRTIKENFLSISLLIIQEKLLIYETCMHDSTIIQFFHRYKWFQVVGSKS